MKVHISSSPTSEVQPSDRSGIQRTIASASEHNIALDSRLRGNDTWWVLILGLLFAFPLPAYATITIGALTQLCGYDEAGKELAPSSHASCQSFIAGIVDYNDLYKSVGKTDPAVDFCLPPALTFNDLQRVVLEYLQKNQNFGESPAAAAVSIALRNEFPCDGSGADGLNLNAPEDPLATGAAGQATSTDDILNTPAETTP